MTIRELGSAVGVSCLCLCVSFCVRAAESGSLQDWQFSTDENPAQPTIVTNATGVPTALIVVGAASSGWLPDLIGFGGQTGIWDLGFQNQMDLTRGRVLLSIPNPAAASGGIYTDVTLRFFQFVDEMIYTGDLELSIPGGRYLGREVVEALPGPLGGNWVEDRFQWRLAPSPATVSLTITGAVNGTVLDRIRVDMAGPEVPKLAITSVKTAGQGLALTWAGGLPPYQVYFTTNLGNAAWEPVGPAVSGTNAEVTLTEPGGFFKVGGRN